MKGKSGQNITVTRGINHARFVTRQKVVKSFYYTVITNCETITYIHPIFNQPNYTPLLLQISSSWWLHLVDCIFW